ncbi:hypothetical protein [Klebsiella sp. WP8-S18-ESBL-06]|uniref:hypothetical protein n=1 Tax=Klebsiella sp. WP8-S18-ESBL-06 TaxID=2675726 RepID=UPI0015DCF971|nr:hypothetical protein [Klebsiella sp. WP8-S18-ESBL-06]BBT71131.1 hypothetical protein WP8S18E06_24300 [Klebsiella sp. WP8-S18-ESBL-06]
MTDDAGTKIIENPPEKIAFMFPAKYSPKGATNPVLNFKTRDNNILPMSVGVSFIELDPKENYLVSIGLEDPEGNSVTNSSHGMSAIPSDEIDPVKRTSFLSANFYFEATSSGIYKFSCELRNLLVNYGNVIDSKEIYFNVTLAGEQGE